MGEPDPRLKSVSWRGPGERRIPLGLAFGLTALLLVGALELIPANSYVLEPGQAIRVAPMISIKGYPEPPRAGHLYMTDVSLYKVDHLLEEIRGRLNPDAQIEPAGVVSGRLSTKQYERQNVAMMSDSIHQAEAAALNALGHKLTCAKDGPRIVLTLRGAPAAGRLKPGDLVQAVRGHHVHCASDVGRLVRQTQVGALVPITVLRHGHRRDVALRTIGSQDGRPNPGGHISFIGVAVQDRFTFPIKVRIRAGDVGGPSAGLMFALGIVERLERRDLTHGCKVAGTGTIDFRGQVGLIGGARQKIIAARHGGAAYFLVPADPANVRPATAARGNISVVPVKTLQQALRYLNRLHPCR